MYFWQDLFSERFFTAALFFCLSFKVFIEVPLFQETCSATKSSWLGACNSHPNFYPNIWGFKNLPIDRKLAHDNISLVFWKPRIFCLVLLWRRCGIVCLQKYRIYSRERPGRSFWFGFSKRDAFSGYALIKYIKKNIKYMRLVSLIKECEQ